MTSWTCHAEDTSQNLMLFKWVIKYGSIKLLECLNCDTFIMEAGKGVDINNDLKQLDCKYVVVQVKFSTIP